MVGSEVAQTSVSGSHICAPDSRPPPKPANADVVPKPYRAAIKAFGSQEALTAAAALPGLCPRRLHPVSAIHAFNVLHPDPVCSNRAGRAKPPDRCRNRPSLQSASGAAQHLVMVLSLGVEGRRRRNQARGKAETG